MLNMTPLADVYNTCARIVSPGLTWNPFRPRSQGGQQVWSPLNSSKKGMIVGELALLTRISTPACQRFALPSKPPIPVHMKTSSTAPLGAVRYWYADGTTNVPETSI